MLGHQNVRVLVSVVLCSGSYVLTPPPPHQPAWLLQGPIQGGPPWFRTCTQPTPFPFRTPQSFRIRLSAT